MSHGNRFKILVPKEIASVVNIISQHSTHTSEAVDKPTPDVVVNFFLHLTQFCYDLDVQHVKAQMPPLLHHWGHGHPEVYDEAMDVLTIFKLTKQLVNINLVDDFNFKDVWEPVPKRFRILLSAIINFCRYKEGKLGFITDMKEALQGLDCSRVELVETCNQIEQEVSSAQEQQRAQLDEMREAEQKERQAQAEVEKTRQLKQSAERLADKAEAKLSAAKERRQRQEQQKERLRQQIADLQSQIAESPEGIEQEIAELQAAVQQQRARLEEASNEKRARQQRDQVLGKLAEGLESAREELFRLAQTVEAAETVAERHSAAEEELARLRGLCEARRAESSELDHRVHQNSSEHERGKRAHEERVQELEARRQRALVQHHELQAKRTEEQKQQHALQMQRMELEAEVAAATRMHDAKVNETRERQMAVQKRAEAYVQHFEALLAQRGGGADGSSATAANDGCASSPVSMKRPPSPEVQLRQRLACSPSPARVSSNPLGFMSPGSAF